MAFTTRQTIIERIRSGEEVAWEDFVNSYRNLIYLRGDDRGLFEYEKADLVQDVMLSLFKNEVILKFDKAKGRFRDYLKKIIDRRAFDILRKRKDKESSLQSMAEGGALFESSEYEQAEKNWECEWQRHLLQQALDQVKSQVNSTTYEAVIMLLVESIEPEQVADILGLSLESVYVAKHRVLKRLKPIVKNLQESE